MKTERTNQERYDERVRRGFDRGNYAAAYETEDYALARRALVNGTAAYRVAFTLGFFSSYELSEMGVHRDAFARAYVSTAGRRAVELGLCERRAELEGA